jgi:hypothetical protein
MALNKVLLMEEQPVSDGECVVVHARQFNSYHVPTSGSRWRGGFGQISDRMRGPLYYTAQFYAKT